MYGFFLKAKMWYLNLELFLLSIEYQMIYDSQIELLFYIIEGILEPVLSCFPSPGYAYN